MSESKMHAGLLAFAEFAGKGTSRSWVIHSLARVFEGAGAKSVKSLVDTIESNWKADAREPSYPYELRDAVFDLQNGLARIGAKTAAKDIGELLRLFQGGRDQSIEEFVADACAARLKRPKAKSGKRGPPLTPEGARGFADQLRSAMDDRKLFDDLVKKLQPMTVADIRSVAGYYMGRATSDRKKGDIIRAIRRWHRDFELERDRHAAQDKVRP
jgi:hypothetical protein